MGLAMIQMLPQDPHNLLVGILVMRQEVIKMMLPQDQIQPLLQIQQDHIITVLAVLPISILDQLLTSFRKMVIKQLV